MVDVLLPPRIRSISASEPTHTAPIGTVHMQTGSPPRLFVQQTDPVGADWHEIEGGGGGGGGSEHGDEMIIMNDQEIADYMVLFEDEGVNFDEMIVMNDQE
jgi:hypothetical protein